MSEWWGRRESNPRLPQSPGEAGADAHSPTGRDSAEGEKAAADIGGGLTCDSRRTRGGPTGSALRTNQSTLELHDRAKLEHAAHKDRLGLQVRRGPVVQASDSAHRVDR